MRVLQACHALGSSPLARGLLTQGGKIVEVYGIIPARAGFTSGRMLLCRLPWDHPRSRGVYGEMTFISGEVAGSSPLARGLHTNTW